MLPAGFSFVGEGPDVASAEPAGSAGFRRNCISNEGEDVFFCLSVSAPLTLSVVLERARETFLKSSNNDSGDLALLSLPNIGSHYTGEA